MITNRKYLYAVVVLLFGANDLRVPCVHDVSPPYVFSKSHVEPSLLPAKAPALGDRPEFDPYEPSLSTDATTLRGNSIWIHSPAYAVPEMVVEKLSEPLYSPSLDMWYALAFEFHVCVGSLPVNTLLKAL